MTRLRIPLGTFFIVGFALWLIGGSMISMCCFEPRATLEMIRTDKSVALSACNSWNTISFGVTALWSFIGGVLGIAVFLLFISRPNHEHYTLVPQQPNLPGMPSGPHTIAELNAGFQGWVIAIIIGLCGAFFILPQFQNEIIVLKCSSSPVIIVTIVTLITTIPILPFSNGLLKKFARRHKF